MKLALFSDNITNDHIDQLKKFFDKDLSEVKICYITTPTNYKPFKPEWCLDSQKKLMSIFPLLQEFDVERAYTVDPKFDFRVHLSQFDFIFVSGGNIFLLSYWMKKTGVNTIIIDLVQKNKIVYGGESAGAIYATRNLMPYGLVDDPQKAPEIVAEGLELVDFAPMPHWENQEFQISLEKAKLEFEKNNLEVITITDDQAIFVEDKKVNVM